MISVDVSGWECPPVDDVGYISSAQLLTASDEELRGVIDRMRQARYGGWRNHGGAWRDVMGLDAGGREVLDFGCGTGMEAAELARAGNRVVIADIITDNMRLTRRVLQLYGFEPAASCMLSTCWPYLSGRWQFDTFHASGVLHHIPQARTVMERAHQLLRPGGDARLMLYSGEGWRLATGTDPPDEPETHWAFHRFVRFFDAVGEYADWYDRDRLEQRFGDLFTVERCEYLTADRRFLGAVLRRNDL